MEVVTNVKGHQFCWHADCIAASKRDVQFEHRLKPEEPQRRVAGYVMKGKEFPNSVFYPASHRPTDIANFDVVYFD